MKIENQVCTIEQAKRFKELGIKQISLFHYVNNWRNPRKEEINDGEHIIMEEEQHLTVLKGRERGTEVVFASAFTVAELGQMLPDKFPSLGYLMGNETELYWFCRNERVDTFPHAEGIGVAPAHLRNRGAVPVVYGGTEAYVRAAMLIALLENKIVTAEATNVRLNFD